MRALATSSSSAAAVSKCRDVVSVVPPPLRLRRVDVDVGRLERRGRDIGHCGSDATVRARVLGVVEASSGAETEWSSGKSLRSHPCRPHGWQSPDARGGNGIWPPCTRFPRPSRPSCPSRGVSTARRRGEVVLGRDVAEHLVLLVVTSRSRLPDRGLWLRWNGARCSSDGLHLSLTAVAYWGLMSRAGGASSLNCDALSGRRVAYWRSRGSGPIRRRRWCEHPGSDRLRSDAEGDADRCIAAVFPACRDQVGGRSRSDRDAGLLRCRGKHRELDVEVVGVGGRQRRRLCREVVRERRVRGGRGRGPWRRLRSREAERVVRRVTALDRRDRVVDGGLNVRHVERPLDLELRRRRSAHRVDRDQVPVERRLR